MLVEIQNLYQEHIEKQDLIEKLNGLMNKGYISYYCGILHDRDIREDGTPKKPHYHLVIEWVSLNHQSVSKQISDYAPPSIATGRYKPIRNLKSFTRYLTHIDYPQKAQYEDGEVFTNDIDLYIDNMEVDIKKGGSSIMLDKFYEDCLYEASIGNKGFQPSAFLWSLKWFKEYGKMDYFMTHTNSLLRVITEMTTQLK